MQYLNTDEMKAFEAYACEHFYITLDDMMQNAGRAIFELVKKLPEKISRILVIAGKGNNGGDALVAADLLRKAGFKVTVFSQSKPIDFNSFDLIIDGLFGFGLEGDPHPPYDRIIEQINCSTAPVLSVDVPSGFNVGTGRPQNPTVRATYTLTLGMPKVGLNKHPEITGKLYLGDLGIPKEAYRQKGYNYPFKGGIVIQRKGL